MVISIKPMHVIYYMYVVISSKTVERHYILLLYKVKPWTHLQFYTVAKLCCIKAQFHIYVHDMPYEKLHT